MSDHIPDLTKMIGETACNATPREELRHQIMSSIIPKNEREWWANRTIEQLERELNEANERIKRLEEWKESAMAVEREWNPNALATMLGGKLGESQRVVIMREVPKLQERIKRLEEAGDAVKERLGCACWFDGLCKACQCTSENWDKAKEAKL